MGEGTVPSIRAAGLWTLPADWRNVSQEGGLGRSPVLFCGTFMHFPVKHFEQEGLFQGKRKLPLLGHGV